MESSTSKWKMESSRSKDDKSYLKEVLEKLCLKEELEKICLKEELEKLCLKEELEKICLKEEIKTLFFQEEIEKICLKVEGFKWYLLQVDDKSHLKEVFEKLCLKEEGFKRELLQVLEKLCLKEEDDKSHLKEVIETLFFQEKGFKRELLQVLEKLCLKEEFEKLCLKEEDDKSHLKEVIETLFFQEKGFKWDLLQVIKKYFIQEEGFKRELLQVLEKLCLQEELEKICLKEEIKTLFFQEEHEKLCLKEELEKICLKEEIKTLFFQEEIEKICLKVEGFKWYLLQVDHKSYLKEVFEILCLKEEGFKRELLQVLEKSCLKEEDYKSHLKEVIQTFFFQEKESRFHSALEKSRFHSALECEKYLEFPVLNDEAKIQVSDTSLQTKSIAVCPKCGETYQDEELLIYHQYICVGEQKMGNFKSTISEENDEAQPSSNDIKCGKHGKMALFYCKENHCSEYVCDDCYVNHEQHTLLRIDENNFYNDLCRLQKICEIRLNRITSSMEYNENEKEKLVKIFNDMESLLKRKHDFLLNIVNSTFENESKKIFDQKKQYLGKIDEISKQLKLSQNILLQIKDSVLESLNVPQLNDFDLCKNIEDSLMKEMKLDLAFVDYESLKRFQSNFNFKSIVPSIEKYIQTQEIPNSTQIALSENESQHCFSCISKPILLSTISNEKKQIHDMVYDPNSSSLFAIELDLITGYQYLVKFNSERFPLQLLGSGISFKNSLTVMSKEEILILCNSKLKIFSKRTSDVNDYSIGLLNSEDIELLRSVRNSQYIFVYTKDSHLMKYNYRDQNEMCASFQLEISLKDFTVSEDDDTIAGIEYSQIYVLSFQQNEILCKLSSSNRLSSVTFIASNDIAVTCQDGDDSTLKILQIKGKSIKNRMELKKEKSHFLFIANFGFSSVFLADDKNIYHLAF